MARGKTRTVRFYEPRIGNEDDQRRPDSRFWGELHAAALSRPPHDREVYFRGTEFAGMAATVKGTRCFHVGRRRKESDFPQNELGADQVGPLPPDLRLIEPMYLVPFGAGVAMIRTSGGPSLSAAERWISQLIPGLGHNETVTLVPILKTDARDKLERAVAVKQLEVKLEAGADVPDQDGGILDALRTATESTYGDATVRLEVSFGRSKPDQDRSEVLRRALRKVGNRPGVQHSSARLLMQDDHGNLSTEHVDFIRDAVTYRIEVGESEAEQPSAEGMVAAALEAVAQYRSQR